MTVEEIKATVRARDGHVCVHCGMEKEEHLHIYGRDLEVHRKTPGSSYAVTECETVCKTCHGKLPRSKVKRKGLLTVQVGGMLAKKMRLIAYTKNKKLRELVEQALTVYVEREFPDMLAAVSAGRLP